MPPKKSILYSNITQFFENLICLNVIIFIGDITFILLKIYVEMVENNTFETKCQILTNFTKMPTIGSTKHWDLNSASLTLLTKIWLSSLWPRSGEGGPRSGSPKVYHCLYQASSKSLSFSFNWGHFSSAYLVISLYIYQKLNLNVSFKKYWDFSMRLIPERVESVVCAPIPFCHKMEVS